MVGKSWLSCLRLQEGCIDSEELQIRAAPADPRARKRNLPRIGGCCHGGALLVLNAI